MKKNKKLFFLSLLAIVFLLLGSAVKDLDRGILFDKAILDLLHKNPNPAPMMLGFMKFISLLGSWKIIIPVIGLISFYLFNKKKYYSLKILVINVFGSFGVNFVLKYIVQRTRPISYFRVAKGGFSFPSGHSMVTASMYLAIAYLLTRDNKSSHKKTWIYSLSAIIILLMGISRVYLGVHWPTDVIGGYIMGYILFEMSKLVIEE